jgi:hypothetical protein
MAVVVVLDAILVDCFPQPCRLKIETHHIRPLGVVCVHQHGVDDPFYRLLNHPLDDNLPPTIPVA